MTTALRRRLLPAAIAWGIGGVPLAASAAEPATTKAPDSAPQTPDARFRDPARRPWGRCTDDVDPCTRPRPARVLLLSLGALGGGVAAGLLFALGDRLAPGDPATLLVGAGALAGGGALVGMAAGRLGADRAALPDRIRPSVASLDWTVAQPANLDERQPHTLALRWAPTWRFSDGSRVRLVGHFGGWPRPRQQVDPRPQTQSSSDGRDGTAPRSLSQRQLSASVGLDWAVALPYPAVRRPERSSFLGPAEVRWRPTFEFRRDTYELGEASTTRTVERTMLLPLTAGARWYLSPRQRFTFYVGPRFDMIAYAEPGQDGLSRGRGVQLGPLYGEAWYDIDVPLTPGRRRDGELRHANVNAMLSMGYVHSRFDGRGFNFGPVVGFLGPFHLAWITRIRPRGSKLAVQAGASARLGNGFSGTLDVGLVVPDFGPGGKR